MRPLLLLQLLLPLALLLLMLLLLILPFVCPPRAEPESVQKATAAKGLVSGLGCFCYPEALACDCEEIMAMTQQSQWIGLGLQGERLGAHAGQRAEVNQDPMPKPIA